MNDSKQLDILEKVLFNLNEQQRKAVECQDSQILCVAGAGTGKTTTLISRILYETQILNHDPLSILCLTFTNNAANEFLERYRLKSNSIYVPKFGTFHSFCYSVLCQENVYSLLGYVQIPTVVDEDQEKLYIDKALLLSSVKLPKSKLKITYQPKVSEMFQYQVYMKTLRKLLISDNVITFDILCYEICKLFIEDDPAIVLYKQQYKSIYVDEFQDTDELQWKFVQSFENASKFLVGDKNQAIYSFRGATSEFIEDLTKDEDWTKIKLEQNYRSTIQICNFSNNLTNDVTFKLKSYKEGNPVIWANTNIFKARNLKDFLSVFDDVAILCRTNIEVTQVTSYLYGASINYSNKNSDKDLVYCALSGEYYENYILSRLDYQTRSSLARDRILNKVPPTYIQNLQRTKFKYDDKIHKIQSIPGFIKLRNSILSISDYHEITKLIDSFYNQYIKKPEEKIYVGTIHSVKGSEFNSVIVYNVQSQYFQLNSKENLNLFYVACTRAKNDLIITTPDSSLLEKKSLN